MRLLAACCAFALVSPAWPADGAKQTLDGAALVQDLELLRDVYGTLHPGLLRYNSLQEIDAAFERAKEKLRNGATRSQTYLQLARLTAQIRCGHTYPNFYNQSNEVVTELFRGKTRLPLYFKWIDGVPVITKNLSPNPLLSPGTAILSINGHPSGQILSTLLKYVRGDGSNDAKRVALLDVTGQDKWEAFDIFFPLLYSAAPVFELVVKRLDGTRVRVRVTAISDADREKERKGQPGTDSNQPAFTRSITDGKAMVITMPTWDLFNSKWDWRAWLDEAIDEAIRIESPRLILDIRGNEGGDDDIGRFILSRLTREPIQLGSYARLVRFREVPDGWKPLLDTWDKSFFYLGRDAEVYTGSLPHLPKESWFELSKTNAHAGTEIVQPRKSRYSGAVAVLVDAQNSSATFQFADAFQSNHLGLLVGEPTGGNQRGIDGGAFFFFHLPRSGIEVDVPLIGYFAVHDVADGGLRPDVFVQMKPSEIAAGTDAPMRAAMTTAVSGKVQ